MYSLATFHIPSHWQYYEFIFVHFNLLKARIKTFDLICKVAVTITQDTNNNNSNNRGSAKNTAKMFHLIRATQSCCWFLSIKLKFPLISPVLLLCIHYWLLPNVNRCIELHNNNNKTVIIATFNHQVQAPTIVSCVHMCALINKKSNSFGILFICCSHRLWIDKINYAWQLNALLLLLQTDTVY